MEEAAAAATKATDAILEKAKAFHLGTALIKYIGDGAIKYSTGTYLNRHLIQLHLDGLVASYDENGVLDLKHPVILIVKKDAINLDQLRPPNEKNSPLQRMDRQLTEKEAMLAAGHHRLGALDKFVLSCVGHMVRLSEERQQASMGEGLGDNPPRPLETIDAAIEEMENKWARAHWYATQLYSDGEWALCTN